MKTIFKAFCVLGAMMVSFSAFAGDDDTTKDTSNRDENGNIVRGPYETSRAFDNTFVGAAWGINMFSNKQNNVTARVTPTALDIYFGKWFTPGFGARIAYSGITGSENSTQTAETTTDGSKLIERFNFAYFHGDVMWNVINTFWGYRDGRLWNVSPYLHAGIMRLYGVSDDANAFTDFRRRTNSSDNEFTAGVGIFNTFSIADHWNITFDIRNMMFSGRFHNWDKGGICNGLAATVGVEYNIGRTGWKRAMQGDNGVGEALAALAAARAALAKVEAEKEELVKEIEELRAVPVVEEKTDTVYVGYALGIAPIRLFFEKGSSELSVTEKMHLKYYVETVIAIDPDRKFNFSGFADAGTGNIEINTRLANERVNNTIKFLNKEYGIDPERLIFRDAVISDENSDPRLDRSVLIEH